MMKPKINNADTPSTQASNKNTRNIEWTISVALTATSSADISKSIAQS